MLRQEAEGGREGRKGCMLLPIYIMVQYGERGDGVEEGLKVAKVE